MSDREALMKMLDHADIPYVDHSQSKNHPANSIWIIRLNGTFEFDNDGNLIQIEND